MIEFEPKSITDINLFSVGGGFTLSHPFRVSDNIFAIHRNYSDSRFLTTFRVEPNYSVTLLHHTKIAEDTSSYAQAGPLRCFDTDYYLLQYKSNDSVGAWPDHFCMIHIDPISGAIQVGNTVTIAPSIPTAAETRRAFWLSENRLIVTEARRRQVPLFGNHFPDGKLRVLRLSRSGLSLSLIDVDEVVFDPNPYTNYPYFNHTLYRLSDNFGLLWSHFQLGPTGVLTVDVIREYSWSTGIGNVIYTKVPAVSSINHHSSYAHYIANDQIIFFPDLILTYDGGIDIQQINITNQRVVDVFWDDSNTLWLTLSIPNPGGQSLPDLVGISKFNLGTLATYDDVTFIPSDDIYTWIPPLYPSRSALLSSNLFLIFNQIGSDQVILFAPPESSPQHQASYVKRFKSELSLLAGSKQEGEDLDGPALDARFSNLQEINTTWDSTQRKQLNTGNRFYILDDFKIKLIHACEEEIVVADPDVPGEIVACVDIDYGYTPPPIPLTVHPNELGVYASEYPMAQGWLPGEYEVSFTPEPNTAFWAFAVEREGVWRTWYSSTDIWDGGDLSDLFSIVIPDSAILYFYTIGGIPEFEGAGTFHACRIGAIMPEPFRVRFGHYDGYPHYSDTYYSISHPSEYGFRYSTFSPLRGETPGVSLEKIGDNEWWNYMAAISLEPPPPNYVYEINIEFKGEILLDETVAGLRLVMEFAPHVGWTTYSTIWQEGDTLEYNSWYPMHVGSGGLITIGMRASCGMNQAEIDMSAFEVIVTLIPEAIG